LAIRSNHWNSSRGAITFISNISTAFGEISENNSIVGVNSDDLSYASVKPLRSGNCLISSTNWNGGRGAVRFIFNCNNTVGTLSEANSLVGSIANQNVGSILELPNGNLIISNPAWNNYRGSITFVNQFTGLPVGFISEANSLVGTTANDLIGVVSGGNDGITILPNSNIIIRSPKWDNGSILDAGALTLISGSTATPGFVSSANSLIGNSANDFIGGNLTVFQDGSFASRTSGWDNGNILNAGAVTFGNSGKSPKGNITNENSVLGTITNGGNSLTYDYSSTTRKFIVGYPSGNLVTFYQLQIFQPTFDFDGDSKTDISIFRPSSGEWWLNRSSTSVTTAAQFGQSTDKPVPADFTGDGKTDLAFYRPSSGQWFILRSEDSSFLSFPFGTNGDVPVVGDFDADGKSDVGVFRPSTNVWYISKSTGGTSIITFGASGDVPVAADYDGDGKTDIAIYRPSFGQWWIVRSSNNSVYAFQFGTSSDKPVQGDYTGDGKADSAFFRPSTGEWFILRSEDSSFYSVPFGTSGDLPAPGDYDGDGKYDTAVFRPSNNTWYVNRSTAGILIAGFGTNGDKPLPNVFVP
jgi:Repeat of unknown function (DUF5650)/FG-GAP-like repeat